MQEQGSSPLSRLPRCSPAHARGRGLVPDTDGILILGPETEPVVDGRRLHFLSGPDDQAAPLQPRTPGAAHTKFKLARAW
jgi:hypothetical protein